MPDQLEQMFAGMRAEVFREIQPPGVAAAQQSVRRRRTVATVGSGVAALVAIGIVVGLTGMAGTAFSPAGSADPAGLAETAQRSLAEKSGAEAAFEGAGPVTEKFEAAQPAFYGAITLRLACAGKGKVTLLVEARPNGVTPFAEVARVSANCSAKPKPASTTFGYDKKPYKVRLRLTDSDAAAGRAGFAYRATSDTGTPYPVDNKLRPDIEALKSRALTTVSGGGDSLGNQTELTPPSGRSGLPDGTYRLAVTCLGSGTAEFEVHLRGKVLAHDTIRCGSPATAKDFPVGRMTDMSRAADAPEVYTGYRSGSPGLARVNWGLFDVP